MTPSDASRGSRDVPTTSYPERSERLPRCRVAHGCASSVYRKEIAPLLQQRLRVVTLIILLPTVFFMLASLLDPDSHHPSDRPMLLAHAGLTLVVSLAAALTWSRQRLSYKQLRATELVVFGTMTAFFAATQFAYFPGPALFQVAEQVKEVPLTRVVIVSTATRWFFLIVIYGVFIPNSARRCALVTGSAALLALGLTAAAAARAGHFDGDVLAALAYLAILLATGVAIAVFGSYRLHQLQEQAIEAQQLGQYRLKRRLGAGGMGEVYLAEHRLLRRPCAVKLIRAEQAGDPTTLQRFEREVRAMATLTHWNTVEVFDYGHADDGTFYYVMEYLPGQNLETLVQRHGPLSPGRAVHFLRQVCRALREAHGIGLLHRDIKPSNVIACERGGVYDVAKLLDFGLVQGIGLGADADKLTVKGAVVGSPPYMSPEQAAGRAQLDARSDIYGVGAVAYFLVTGQPPFARETPMEMLLAHTYEPAVPPSQLRPDLPSDLEAVILGCLQKKPGQRFTDADSLEKALARCACASEWGEEQAAAWWKRYGGAPEATDDEIAALPTEISAR